MATLATLAERISKARADDIAEDLPERLRFWLADAKEDAEAFHVEEFIRRVAEREETDAATGARHARAVFRALARVAPAYEINDLVDELPHEFEPLIGDVAAEIMARAQPESPTYERVPGPRPAPGGPGPRRGRAGRRCRPRDARRAARGRRGRGPAGGAAGPAARAARARQGARARPQGGVRGHPVHEVGHGVAHPVGRTRGGGRSPRARRGARPEAGIAATPSSGPPTAVAAARRRCAAPRPARPPRRPSRSRPAGPGLRPVRRSLRPPRRSTPALPASRWTTCSGASLAGRPRSAMSR